MFLHGEVVSTSPKHAAGLPPIIDHPRLFIQYIHSYHTYWKLFVHPHPEGTTGHFNRDRLIMENIKYLKIILKSLKSVLPDFNDLNISILFFRIIYGKDSSGSILCRNFFFSRKATSFSFHLSRHMDTEKQTVTRNRMQHTYH